MAHSSAFSGYQKPNKTEKRLSNHETTSPKRWKTRDRDLNRDMEALRLSRQDNPYLQCLASREGSNDSEEMQNDTEAASLITKNNEGFMKMNEALSLLEVHEHMIRSPPPLTLPDQQEPRFHYVASAEVGLRKLVVGSQLISKDKK